jgi:TolB protein
MDASVTMRRLPGHPRPTFAPALIAGAAVVALLAQGSPAHATFPGHNGEIAYRDLVGVYSDSETVTTLVRVCADGFPEWDLLPRGWEGSVAYSPDGRMVATDGISLAAVTGRSERKVSRPPRGAFDAGPVWSPRGGAIAFTRARYTRVGRLRSIAVRIYEEGHGRFLSAGFAPAWSVRDQVAFVRGDYDDTSTHEVRVASLRSGSVRRLATGYAPDWSPNGRRLVFSYLLPGETRGPNLEPAVELATIRADGTGRRHLASGDGGSWSPDGRRLAFLTPDGYVAVVSPSGRGLLRLARSDSDPIFSPDSRWLAYTWKEELYVVPVKGGSRRFVTSPSEELELLDWRAAPASQTRC